MRTATAILMAMAACAWGQVQFDGTNQYLQFPNPQNFSTELTITAWANLQVVSATFKTIVAISDATNNTFFLGFDPVSNKLQFQATTTNNSSLVAVRVVGSTVIENVGRVFVAATYSGHTTNTYLYVNGIKEVSTSTGADSFGPLLNINQPIFVASWSLSNLIPWDGILEDVRVYQRALTAAEIAEIYARAWALADDPDLVLRTCIVTNDTGSALTGTAPNLNGAGGTYSNSPTAAPWTQQFTKPRKATYYPPYSTNLVRDLSGNGNTATNYGASLYEAVDGWTASFDGTSDYMSMAAPTNVLGTNDYTITYWAKITKNTSASMHYHSQAYKGVLITHFSGGVDILHGGGSAWQNLWGSTSGVLPIQTNVNVMCSFVRQSNVVTAYSNGVYSASVTNANSIALSAANISTISRINGNDTVRLFGGELSDMRIYNRALSAAEIGQLYSNRTALATDANLVLYLPMQPEYQ